MPSGKHRQGSGFSRREALRFLGSASALRTPLIDGTYQQGIANMASSTPIALHDLA